LWAPLNQFGGHIVHQWTMVQHHIQKTDVLLYQYLYKRHFKLRHMLLCSRTLARS
jgi:hypothetical protein